MTTSLLERLEADIERLSLTDQLWSMERLAIVSVSELAQLRSCRRAT